MLPAVLFFLLVPRLTNYYTLKKERFLAGYYRWVPKPDINVYGKGPRRSRGPAQGRRPGVYLTGLLYVATNVNKFILVL